MISSLREAMLLLNFLLKCLFLLLYSAALIAAVYGTLTVNPQEDPQESRSSKEFQMWVGIIAGTELIRFSGTVCLLLGSGLLLQKYLQVFLIQQQLWDRNGQLFESILKQERATMGGSISSRSPSSLVEESKSCAAGARQEPNDSSVVVSQKSKIIISAVFSCCWLYASSYDHYYLLLIYFML